LLFLFSSSFPLDGKEAKDQAAAKPPAARPPHPMQQRGPVAHLDNNKEKEGWNSEVPRRGSE